MYVDALALAALRDELQDALLGGRVDDVIQPTPYAVALQCYSHGQNFWLLVSAHPQYARVHLIEQKPRKLVAEPPAFVMLLRKHLEGARVVVIRQPQWERVLEIGVAHGPYVEGADAQAWLVIEVMGKLSNIVLRDAHNVILGALRLVNSEVNQYRAILPHVPYLYPPAQTRRLGATVTARLDPATVTVADLREAAADFLTQPGRARGKKAADTSVAGLLAAQVAGFSRDLGAEAAARAMGEPDAPVQPGTDWNAIVEAIHDLAGVYEARAWRPTLIYTPPDLERPAAFSVFTPARFPGAELRSAPSVSAALATYYAGAEWRGAVDAAKGDLRRVLRTARDRLTRKEEALREELRGLDEGRRLREEADLLLAFQADVPRGASVFTITDPFAEDPDAARELALDLDPRLDAVGNANKRYQRYHKLQRAAEMIPAQIDANAVEAARTDQMLTDLDLAETLPEIELVRQEVAEAGYLRRSGHKQVESAKDARRRQAKGAKGSKGGKRGQTPAKVLRGGAPLKRQSADGFAMLVGKNSNQNETVTFHEATGNDLWLHARGVPGAHVVVRSAGRAIPETTVREAAGLAAYYSQARDAGTVPVDVTEQRHVRHMKGGGPGMVIYDHERTLYVAPEAGLGA